MCGFVGFVNQDYTKPLDSSVLRSMSETLYHRGPDDHGYFIKSNVGIAHRRLSIIDTTVNGRQPIVNEDQSVVAVLNGEIYNYQTLKHELQSEGHVFYTKTDTEVLVHAYEKWGVLFLEKLDGMFSLAVYDINNDKLILAKDPFGKKPLYYAQQNGVFLFASELKAFSPHPDFEKSLSQQSMIKYLAYDYVPSPNCIFKNCYKLPAASYLTLDTKDVTKINKINKYWNLEYEPKLVISLEDASEKLNKLLVEAVNKRLVSDVPIGAFLSGGVDSSAIVALMVELQGRSKVKTFNIGFNEKSFDESRNAQQVANLLGTVHHEKKLDPETMLKVFPEILENLDEPFADASIIPTYLLCEFAKEHVTVALGGDGADELFAGYDTFLANRFSFLLESLPYNLIKTLRYLATHLPISEKNMDTAFKINHLLKGYNPYSKKLPAGTGFWAAIIAHSARIAHRYSPGFAI